MSESDNFTISGCILWALGVFICLGILLMPPPSIAKDVGASTMNGKGRAVKRELARETVLREKQKYAQDLILAAEIINGRAYFSWLNGDCPINEDSTSIRQLTVGRSYDLK